MTDKTSLDSDTRTDRTEGNEHREEGDKTDEGPDEEPVPRDADGSCRDLDSRWRIARIVSRTLTGLTLLEIRMRFIQDCILDSKDKPIILMIFSKG